MFQHPTAVAVAVVCEAAPGLGRFVAHHRAKRQLAGQVKGRTEKPAAIAKVHPGQAVDTQRFQFGTAGAAGRGQVATVAAQVLALGDLGYCSIIAEQDREIPGAIDSYAWLTQPLPLRMIAPRPVGGPDHQVATADSPSSARDSLTRLAAQNWPSLCPMVPPMYGELPNPELHSEKGSVLPSVAGAAVMVIGLVGAGLGLWLTRIKFASCFDPDGSDFSLCKKVGSQCDIVFASDWSTWFGIPVTVFATSFYVAVAGLGVLWFLRERDEVQPCADIFVAAAISAACVSLAMAAYAYLGLGVWCLYCSFLYAVALATLGLAVIFTDRAPADLLRHAVFGKWINADNVMTLVGLAAAALIAVAVQSVVYANNASSQLGLALEIKAEVPEPVAKFPELVKPKAIIAEFIDPQCRHCLAQYRDFHRLATTSPAFADVQIWTFVYPKSQDSRCCPRSARGSLRSCEDAANTAAGTCAAAVTLACAAKAGPGASGKVLEAVWLRQEQARNAGESATMEMFADNRIKASVREVGGIPGAADTDGFVARCLVDGDASHLVQAHVALGERLLAAGRPLGADVSLTPFSFVLPTMSGKPDWTRARRAIGEKCKDFWSTSLLHAKKQALP